MLPAKPLWPLLLAALAAPALGGCANRVLDEQLAFSDSLIGDYGLGEDHKRQLQYYLSRPVLLARSGATSVRGIAEGRLVDRGLRDIETLRIPAQAPGVAVGSGPNWLAVSFEGGSYLYFVSGQAPRESLSGSDSRDPDRYYLYTPDWDGRTGTVKLDGFSYQAVERSGEAFLLVDRESLYRSENRQRELSGRLLERSGR